MIEEGDKEDEEGEGEAPRGEEPNGDRVSKTKEKTMGRQKAIAAAALREQKEIQPRARRRWGLRLAPLILVIKTYLKETMISEPRLLLLIICDLDMAPHGTARAGEEEGAKWGARGRWVAEIDI